MKLIFILLAVLHVVPVISNAQNDKPSPLNIGDKAPQLYLKSWLKGIPVQRFEKGMVYVVEFWATWCAPCKAAIPHLSELAGKYKDNITILGIDVLEKKNSSFKKVKNFVDSLGDRMNYLVAVEDSNLMVTNWLLASGENQRGIPATFIVNQEGKIAWIGHPKDIDKVLAKIVGETWDINAALKESNFNNYLRNLDDSLNNSLWKYRGDPYNTKDFGQPDSMLLEIDKIIFKEPRLKYAPLIAYNTFSALLKTNQGKALEYGKLAIMTFTYEEPASFSIINSINYLSHSFNFSEQIFRLGAEAYQVQIEQIPYPEIANTEKQYNKMAEWYSCAGDNTKAMKAQEKAIEILKNKQNFSKSEMAEFEYRFLKYKKDAELYTSKHDD